MPDAQMFFALGRKAQPKVQPRDTSLRPEVIVSGFLDL